MSDDKKMCPLITNATGWSAPCRKEQCAWWIERYNGSYLVESGCAMVMKRV